MKKEDLLNLANSYYPYDLIEYYNKEYYVSKEYIRLQESRKNYYLLQETWKILFSKLSDIFSDSIYRLENWQEESSREMCFTGRIISKSLLNIEEYDVVVFNVSFIAPIYSFYLSKYPYPDFNIPNHLKPIYTKIASTIKEYFVSYSELLPELANIELNGLSTDNVGKPTWIDSNIIRNMTLFNAFFTSNYY